MWLKALCTTLIKNMFCYQNVQKKALLLYEAQPIAFPPPPACRTCARKGVCSNLTAHNACSHSSVAMLASLAALIQ